ncbi:hypothetical protein JQ629_28170 [Bradyrhizobium sp. AUGA SZCCT0222]|uniref:hypothetical protein n=1 Tax=Bradyrhizobium sp. AUGA SZCCT0222 TaxID=2807668 RepID=UPI001BA73451|nr:hypothetical protein [Bradyrhizobium sp. AUGA SZCCT0222]MBR1271366.1 hypothetical protein [Bradyrhizobium sp. AUGA SZCCT0222]
MRKKGISLSTLLSVVTLTGCGVLVPEIRDFPNAGSAAQNNLLVQAIVISIRCELQDAVTNVINADVDTAKANRFYYAQFLKNWGAQVALTLRMEEKSSISPNGAYLPVSPLTSVFSLSGGLSATADATRVDKINFYYKVTELYLGRDRKCIRDTNPPRDSLLIQSDLKLGEWLDAMINGSATGIITAVSNKNVLSHQITFQVTTAGNLTPAWRLVRGTVNQSGSFLTASRDRQHDLVVTFGPLDTTQSGSFLLPIAENSHTSSQLISGVTTGFKSALGQ